MSSRKPRAKSSPRASSTIELWSRTQTYSPFRWRSRYSAGSPRALRSRAQPASSRSRRHRDAGAARRSSCCRSSPRPPAEQLLDLRACVDVRRVIVDIVDVGHERQRFDQLAVAALRLVALTLGSLAFADVVVEHEEAVTRADLGIDRCREDAQVEQRAGRASTLDLDSLQGLARMMRWCSSSEPASCPAGRSGSSCRPPRRRASRRALRPCGSRSRRERPRRRRSSQAAARRSVSRAARGRAARSARCGCARSRTRRRDRQARRSAESRRVRRGDVTTRVEADHDPAADRGDDRRSQDRRAALSN